MIQTLTYGIVALLALLVAYGAYLSRVGTTFDQATGMTLKGTAVLVSDPVGSDATVAQRWFGPDVEVKRGLRNLAEPVALLVGAAIVIYGLGKALELVIGNV